MTYFGLTEWGAINWAIVIIALGLVAGATPPNIPADVYLNAVDTARFQLQATYRRYFREHDVAAIVFPTTLLPARPIGQDNTVELNGQQVPTFTTYIHNTDPGSNAGIPGVTIPAGLTAGGRRSAGP